MEAFIFLGLVVFMCCVIGFAMNRVFITKRNLERLNEFAGQIVWITSKYWFTTYEYPVHLTDEQYCDLVEKIGGGVENCFLDIRTPRGDAHEERVCLDLLAAGDEIRLHIVVPRTELLKQFTNHTMGQTRHDPRIPIHEEVNPPMPPRPEGQLISIPNREVQAALAELEAGPSVIVEMNDDVVEGHRPTIAHTPAPLPPADVGAEASILETRRDDAPLVVGDEPENSARKTLFMGSPPRRRDPDKGA